MSWSILLENLKNLIALISRYRAELYAIREIYTPASIKENQYVHIVVSPLRIAKQYNMIVKANLLCTMWCCLRSEEKTYVLT